MTKNVKRDAKTEAVVLVHGLAAIRLAMWPIAKRLSKSGYQVKNHRYVSIFKEIPHYSKGLGEALDAFENDPAITKIHLVTHSMGCITGRHLLSQRRFEKLGRWVMLAPPNHGSHAARKLTPFLGKLCPPLTELTDAPDSFVNQLDDFRETNDVDFAVVEAAYDHVIKPSCVGLEGQSDYTVVNSLHGILPWHSDAIDYVEHFLTREDGGNSRVSV